MYLLVFGVAILFILRLFYLQIMSNDYQERAERNAYYHKAIYPSRGVIYDRHGNILVSNKPAYDLMVTMSVAKKQLDTLALAKVLSISPEELGEYLTKVKDRRYNRGYSPYTPQSLITQLDPVEAARVQEQLYKFPGFSIQARTTRQYDYRHAAHILGYLSEASQFDLERDSLLSRGDYVGKSGVESHYDSLLRGTKGKEILLRDSRGRIKGRYDEGRSDVAPINGYDLVLSIDSGLQAIGERMMQGKRGAVVAIEPSTGEILALVTAPSFDPALLSGKDKGEQFRMLTEQEGKPLINRAIMGMYPPGSTFKAGQAAVFLQDGVFTPETRLACYGGYPLLGRRPKCHPHAPSPAVVYSLTTSCNSYYCWGMHYLLDDRSRFKTIQEAFEHWKERMVAMGYGYRTGIDISGEKRGYIPNSKVYDKAFGKKWTSANIISISIGQGEILTTPLQTANLAAIVANRGTWRRPHVVHEVKGAKLDTMYTNVQQTGIESRHWEYVVEGMAQAVKAGTCRAANFAPREFEVCGKTGTAQNPHGRDHSAFIGFAPRNQPKIAVGVYVENGGFGARFGVPIGRVMMEYYLREGKLSGSGQAVANSMARTSISYPISIK